MTRQLLAKIAGHFWWPAEFENVANPDFEHLKHLQNPEHLLLTEPSSIKDTYVCEDETWLEILAAAAFAVYLQQIGLKFIVRTNYYLAVTSLSQ